MPDVRLQRTRDAYDEPQRVVVEVAPVRAECWLDHPAMQSFAGEKFEAAMATLNAYRLGLRQGAE